MTVSFCAASASDPDFRIAYRRVGAQMGSVPILFVHGLSFFSYDWLPAARALGREAACMDMRGFGDSSWAKDYSVPAMASDIGALLQHLGWDRAIVVGHSMGGRTAAWFAAHNPRRVAALVLVDYAPDIAAAGSKRVAQSVAGVPDAFASIEAAMAHFNAGPGKRERFEQYLRPAPGGYAIKRDPHFRDQFRKALETGERAKPGVDLWRALGELAMPTLVVRGTRSDLFALETAAKVTAANPRIRLAEVDAGHNVAGDNLEGLLAALRPFLASLEEPHAHARH